MTLVADVGGTNTRCALASHDGVVRHVHAVGNDDFDSLEDLLKHYVDGREHPPIASVTLAVAAPVDGFPLTLTNREWIIDPRKLAGRLGVNDVHVMNDCAAIALSTPWLSDDDCVCIHAGQVHARAPRVVVAPGTGLGAAALVPCGDGWNAVAGEGGHVTAAAASAQETRILDMLRQRFGHVSAERVISGQGLVNLYQALQALSAQGSSVPVTAPADITQLSNEGTDPLARQACELFLRLLGGFAGDMALTLGARGGVYLAGGILPRFELAMSAPLITERFLDKGRFRNWLSRVPIWLITHPYPALMGMAIDSGSRLRAS